jgi:hypothetical protein
MQLTGSPGRFIFNGKEYDDSYGFDLYYYGARYMSPALGRTNLELISAKTYNILDNLHLGGIYYH